MNMKVYSLAPIDFEHPAFTSTTILEKFDFSRITYSLNQIDWLRTFGFATMIVDDA